MFFDIGPLELVALAVIAMLVLGPDKLPRSAADAARVLRRVHRMANDAKAETKGLRDDEHDRRATEHAGPHWPCPGAPGVYAIPRAGCR